MAKYAVGQLCKITITDRFRLKPKEVIGTILEIDNNTLMYTVQAGKTSRCLHEDKIRLA